MTLEQIIELTVNTEARVLNNTEEGQAITEKLIEIVKANKPDVSMTEWREIQRDFLTWLFFNFMNENQEARGMLAAAYYKAARA